MKVEISTYKIHITTKTVHEVTLQALSEEDALWAAEAMVECNSPKSKLISRSYSGVNATEPKESESEVLTPEIQALAHLTKNDPELKEKLISYISENEEQLAPLRKYLGYGDL